MTAAWQSKLARLSRMDGEELRFRIGQAVHKRIDLLKYRIGLGNGAQNLSAASALEWQRGTFFFSATESLERAEAVRTNLPHEAAGLLREADEIYDHRFRLLGYNNLEFARAGDLRQIDWHLDPVHGKRAPLAPWFKIPFLDFAAVGDHKITWELNRHQHLVTLAKARLLSGDEKYTDEIANQWSSWIAANPYPFGINWGSTLEVAFRSLSWIWIDHLLAGLADCDQFRRRLLPELAFHGRYIEHYLSTYFSPNTHLLGEALALFFIGTLYPQMPGAARWKHSGWQILLHESERQVRPDGVYFEQSLHYHVYALDFFLHARLLAAKNRMEIPIAFDEALRRMLDLIAALAQAGPAEGFGDDDGGRLWNPRRNRTEHMTDPLALGALIYGRKFSAACLTEEAIWLFGSEGVDQLISKENAKAAGMGIQSRAFPDGGIYVMADSEPRPLTIMIDAGPQGVGRSGHGHADALSLRLTMDGRRWLVDSGSGVYISGNQADRNNFRGTGAHNTLRVDGLDQAVPEEAFSWTQIPATVAENWLAGKSFSYFVGSHNGYTRLTDPVAHRRHVMKIAGGPCLVRDVAWGRAEHELETRWHFASDLRIEPVRPGLLEVSNIEVSNIGLSRNDADSGLRFVVPTDGVWQTEVSQTQVSPAYGCFQSAPLVRCSARVLLPAETAVILAPFVNLKSSDDESAPLSHLAGSTQTGVQVYTFSCGDERHEFFFALGDEAWQSVEWSSDARVVYCRTKKDALTHLVVIGGTYLHWRDQAVLKSATAVRFIEWDRKLGAGELPEQVTVTPLFRELTAELNSSSPERGRSSKDYSSPAYAEKD